VANKHGKAKAQGGGKIKVADKAEEQLIEEIERLRQKVDKLRQSEQKYRAILENIVEGYYEVDFVGNFTFVTNSICADTGYSRDELLGMNNRAYMDKQNAKKVFERFAEVYTTGEPATEFGFEVIRKNGTKLFATCSVSLIMDAKSQPTGFRGIIRNVTEQKKAETALRESEERYRNLFETATDGIFTVDVNTRFTSGNRKAEEMCGYSRAELIGQYATVILPEEEVPRMADILKKVLKGEINTYETKIITKNGDLLPVEVTSSPIEKDGKIIGALSMARDISERKRAEEKLRRSEEKYRTILENITDGYYEIDLAGNFTFFNNSMCEIIGYPQCEMMGMNNRQYMDKENARKVYQTFNKVYTTGKPSRAFDWELIRKDGTKRTVEASVSLVRNPQGEPAGFRGIVRDVTERKRMETERAELERKTQLASRLSIIGEMASGMIHEINNPLASVVGFAEMLADKELPEDAREYAAIINNEGKRVANIVGRLLDFARRQKPETVYTDINKLIEDTINLQSYEMTTGNIKVTAQLDPHLPRTMADPGQLQQVFLNIMLNARTEMRTAHGGGKLLVQTQALDDTIQISFKDDGPGIPQKNLKRIFNPFFTTRKTGGGTGLGLSICRGIISSHRGMIYAESTLGKGATFIIELPVVARQRKTTQARSTINKPRRPARVRR